MSNVIERVLKLKRGEILPITPDEVQEITDVIIRCYHGHKVAIEHFGYGNGKKGRRRIATFCGTSTNIKTKKLTVRARIGEQDEIKIPSHCIKGVDRRGNLYADLLAQ